MQALSSEVPTSPENVQVSGSCRSSVAVRQAKRRRLTKARCKAQAKQRVEFDLPSDEEYENSRFDKMTDAHSMQGFYHESTLSAPGFKSKKALSAIRKEEEARALTKRLQKMPGWYKDMNLDPENLPIPEYLRVIKKKLEKDHGGQRRFRRKKAKKDAPPPNIQAEWDRDFNDRHLH